MLSKQAFLHSAALKTENAGMSQAHDPSHPAPHDLQHYQTVAATPFSDEERAAVYRAIHERRDMRHFAPGTVGDDVLLRLLRAAHHAPSVGFMQPWRFIRIRSRGMREGIHALVEQERVLTAQALGVRQDDFMQLKVQGVLDAAEVLIVALPPGREAHVFGRRTMPEMDVASAACAIQNLWLAARAEGIGMGWVSFFEPARLAARLALPTGARPIAVLCLGPVDAFYPRPQFEDAGFGARLPLDDILFENGWPDGAGPTPSAY